MDVKLRKGEEGAQWVSVPCWHNCGGRCLIKALVRDGEILRMKTDDVHEDTWERPQMRSCPMGHAMRQQVLGEDRLRHPMKRRHWSPEDPHRELRGVDEWERISWDEALDYLADELKAAKEEAGNESILYMNMINLEGYLGQVLAAFGGYLDCTGTQSTGTFGLANPQFGFGELYGSSNDRMDLENSDYIVLMGHNAAWCAFGQASLYLKHAKEKGAKFVFVGPEYSFTAGFANAQWIPVRPGTDTALLLGVAYSMITRDEDGSLIDWDFLDRCTVGFDAAHMPADARTDESFRDYVLGMSDGIPKTQEWASEICGTPVELIDLFADINSCKNRVSFHSNSAPARCKGSENYPQMLMTIAAMGGHFGTPGNSCANDQYYGAMNSGILVHVPYSGTPVRFTNAGNPVGKCVSLDSIWDAILDGEYWDAGNNFPGCEVHEPVRETCDVRVLISEANNFLASQANTNRGIEAFRKVGFVFASAYYMKVDAQYADVVVPVTTRWENAQAHLYGGTNMKDKECSFASRAPIPRVGESRSDREVAAGVAARLGFDYEAMNPKSDEQCWFEQITQSAVMYPDGPRPIASVTEADLDRYGVEGEPQEGIMPLEQYLDEGGYRQERSYDDPWANPMAQPFAAFVADPEANPLPTTASGKFEIYCQAKSDWFDRVNGYADGGEGIMDFVRVSPLPKHLEAPETYQASFTDWEHKVKGPYPVQMTHLHYLRRAHTDCDNLPWLREALQNPVFINKQDAEERGIKTGDVVRVFNGNGQFLRPASVTRTVMPGVIVVPHGASARIDRATGIDLAGADNILTSSNRTTTPFLNSWNSNLVQYEKYVGSIELPPDCEMPPIIPLAE
ncbi:molybdopterin-dependent oxidoreductase [Adlercreutzia faecimuris]|uniref:Molybdopterin-dependent oxidoreductase n=1 Tax=Adlercreutzia faecimuris TaxID=2897341 RepID=A0ABS9WEN1_9ACTN|nr:molybdopterin-dependent oxidoreductase [Adlercreutzia sp. JBNU-10]MCI2241323.1 molybdopterin-dependent oxidoreductase [Adlercreutzia sp. JBNU-10]